MPRRSDLRVVLVLASLAGLVGGPTAALASPATPTSYRSLAAFANLKVVKQ